MPLKLICIKFEVPAVAGIRAVTDSLFVGDGAVVNHTIVAYYAEENFSCYYASVGEVDGEVIKWVVEVLCGVNGYLDSEGLCGFIVAVIF